MTKILFLIVFIIYGALISGISYHTSNYYKDKETKTKLIQRQESTFENKLYSLELKINSLKNDLIALKENKTFKKYLELETNKEVFELFSLMINSDKDIYQLRFLDSNGNEKIRFERDNISSPVIKIEDKDLQNKASRYYFNEIKNIKKDTIWFSRVDLNEEYGKIEKPFIPTLRMGVPIYYNEVFKGVLIMNVFFENTINNLVNSPFFNISIYNKDGEFIYNKMKIDSKIVDNSWSMSIKRDFNFFKYLEYIENKFSNEDINSCFLSFSLDTVIPNDDKLTIFYEPNENELIKIIENERNYILIVSMIVLGLSIFLAFILSIIPNLLNDKLHKLKDTLEKKIRVIDEYVNLCVTDKNGVIIDVSKSYCNLTGYTRAELIGKRHNILRYEKTENRVYKELWETINNKKIWEGELTNVKKDGEIFNTKILITPELDENQNIVNFIAYSQDISYQKKIELISVTDELTKLYNKREFNNIFTRSVENAKRFNNPYTMLMIDIDFFKQYNDSYGHLKGDYALESVAKAMKKCCTRSTDISFRLGGEEFGLIFIASNQKEALVFAKKIQDEIHNLKIEHKSSKVSSYLTVSIGLFFSENIRDFSKDDIYQRCDDALYFAKKAGRNNIYSIDTLSF
ncbi:sensor domain-containing diguanylate cyclase [Arcobacter acticola]|uniref:sensor domain-containing diguanylate cyclase n=1 Tax=Arcobacter acticola TaxID=1849015 RepID=UPI0015563DAA|nr:sensor domain-containing diguanylate cyclase [Arcobacter acticola]